MRETPYRYLYNPRRASTEELRRTLVARQPLLQRLLEELQAQSQAPSLQHLLLIGPRGSGKTHLATLLAREVLEGSLAAAWRPIQLAEEEWGVANLRDLLVATFEAMQADPSDDFSTLPSELAPEAAIEAIHAADSPEQSAEIGLALLSDLARATGRRNLLVVENLDTLLGKQFTDAWGLRRLRSELMTGQDLLLVATAPRRVPELERTDNPLFGLMRPHYLEDLTLGELQELLARRAALEAQSDPNGPAARFQERMRREAHHLKALLFLTGGNPRTALMLYQVAVYEVLDRVRLGLEALLDELTPYFQGRLNELPAQECQIVLCLAQSGRALRPSEIAAQVHLDPSHVSSLLGRLVDRGHVRLAPQREGRARYYVLREVLLRYWRQWRAHRQEFSLFVDFVAAWFHREEIARWLENAKASQRQGWSELLRQALAAQPEVYDRMGLNQTLYQETYIQVASHTNMAQSVRTTLLLPALLREYPLPPDGLGGRLLAARKRGDFQEADRLATELAEALVRRDIPADQEIGLLANLVDYGFSAPPLAAAEAVHRRRPHQMEARFLRALALANANQWKEAASELEALLPDAVADEDRAAEASCWYELGRVQFYLGLSTEWQKTLQQAAEVFTSLRDQLGEAHCLRRAGDLLLQMGDLAGAQADLEKARSLYQAVGYQRGEIHCAQRLGDVHLRLAQYAAARAWYKKALLLYRSLGDQLGEAHYVKSLGDVHFGMAEYAEAQECYEEARLLYRSLGTQWGEIHCIQRLGDVHLSLAEYGEARGRFEEARLLYRSLGDGLGEAHCVKSLGDLHFRMAEYSRARERYENALLLYRSLGARLGETECLASLNRLLVAEITQPLKVHSPFVVRLVSAMEVFDEAQPTTESLERLREVLVEGFAEEETAEITASLLTGEFVWRLQKECCDDLLSWLERIDGWLPPERQGLFRSIEVAARHLRGADEDRRLLDQQPPEVRAIVEEIIREAGK